MKFTINVFMENKLKIAYIKEINNYFQVNVSEVKVGEYKVDEDILLQIIKENSAQQYEKFQRIIEGRKQLNDKDIVQYDGNSERFVMCLHPSRTCNLACRYCFAQHDYLPEKRMSIDIAKKAIDFFIYSFAKNANQFVIDLSGSGEPLLQFNFIKEIEEYVSLKRDELGKDIMIMFCTNGTLLDKEKADYLKSKSRIILGVSIDGNREDNKNRVYPNQEESYKDVLKGIDLLAPKKVGLAVTFTKYNENVDEIFYTLSDVDNCDCVSIQNVRDFSQSEYSFDKVNLKNVFNSYERLIDKIIKNILTDNFDYFEKMIKGSDTLGMYIQKVLYKGNLNLYRCSAGKNRIAVDDNGLVYTCSVMNGCEEFCIGSIFDGLNMEKINKFTKPFMVSDHCKNCWAAYVCSGECNANSYYTHGELYRPNDKLCKYRKKLIRLAIYFWTSLESLNNEKYKQARQMVYRVSKFIVQDKGAWVVTTFLKKKGINKHYEDVLDNLYQDENGISPFEIKRYLNENTEMKFEVFKINDMNILKEVKLPAIGYLNKNAVPYYEYCLILEIDNTYVKIKIMRNNMEIKVSYDELMKVCNVIILEG